MENTLLIGDFLFVNKAVFGGELEIPVTGIHCCRLPAFRAPRRQEVVVFRSVEDSTPDLNIVKRVMGIPGDTLQMAHDTVIRNGQRLDEPYALHTALTPVPDEEFRLQQIKAWQLPQYVGRDPVHYRPMTYASTSCPFSSFTRNVVLGSTSVTVPIIWIASPATQMPPIVHAVRGSMVASRGSSIPRAI